MERWGTEGGWVFKIKTLYEAEVLNVKKIKFGRFKLDKFCTQKCAYRHKQLETLKLKKQGKNGEKKVSVKKACLYFTKIRLGQYQEVTEVKKYKNTI